MVAITDNTVPLPPPVVPHHHHEVEGRNRSALSSPILRQHIKEYKFFQRKPSYTDLSQTDESRASTKTSDSTTACSDSDFEEDLVTLPRRKVSASTAEVRSKFFHKLGIAPPAAHASLQKRRSESTTPQRPCHDPSYETPLNDSHEGSDLASLLKRGLAFFHQSSSLSSSGSDSTAREATTTTTPTEENNNDPHRPVMKRSVRFEPTVKVHPIPKHSVYSRRIRETIWTSAQEMEENVARNCIEYTAEGWDWETVLEDQDMIVFHGELVHPVHFAEIIE